MIWLVAGAVVLVVVVVFVLGLCRVAGGRRGPDDEIGRRVDEAGRRLLDFSRRRL